MIKINVSRCILLLAFATLILPYANALTPWYNLTNFTDEDQLVGIFKAANQYTSGIFGLAVYIGFFLLLLYLFSDYQTKEAIAASTFLTAIVGIIFLPLNFISPWLILLFIIGAVGSMISLFT